MDLRDKTIVTFHNGTNTIGGTLIEIAYKKSRIFFDFGSVWNPNDSSPEPTNLEEYLNTDHSVFIENLYDESFTKPKTDLQYKNQGIFISHVHLDHSKLINFVDKNMPVYLSNNSKILLQALNEKNTFLYPLRNLSENNETLAQDVFTRDLIGIDYNEKVQVGEINVTFLPVDHDAYGACGFIITTPTSTIAYSGDLRLHGYREKDTLNFCKQAKSCDLLIIEGVSVSNFEVASPEEETLIKCETELIDDFITILKNNNNRQISFNYYICNIERILNIIKYCSKYREIVLEAHHASVLKKVTGLEVRYYKLDNFNYDLDPNKEIAIEILLKDTNSFFWQLEKVALKYIGEMVNGGLYLHSNAQPLGPFDPSYEPFFQLFEDNNIETKVLSCTGHAYTQDLMRIINWINPKTLCPIHSFHPERLYNLSGKRILPEKGQSLELF